MFLPPHVRLLSIGICANVAWVFLSVGLIASCGALRALIEGPAYASVGLLFVAPPLLFVGVEAMRQLRRIV